jgi:AraC family transcriptional activator of pobA
MTALPTIPPISIHDLGSFIEERSSQRPLPLRFDSFMIFWVLEGAGSYRMDLRQCPFSNDMVYCIHPGQLNIFADAEYMKGYALSFTSEFLCPLKDDTDILLNSGLFNVCTPNPVTIRPEIKMEMEQLLNSIIKEYKGGYELKSEVLRALLKILIIQLSRRMGTFGTAERKITGDTRLAKDFLALVHKNFLTIKKVSDYADTLGTAPNYLNLKVKKVTGFTASYHIKQRILQEAKRQARWEGMSLKQIAYALGFDDISHFSKFFKKTAGINFSEFKRVEFAG